MEELTEYERRREANVLRNAAMIAALGVQNVVQDLRSTHVSRVEQKGYKLLAADKKRSRTEPIVLRRSLRSKGLSPDNELKLGIDSDDESSSPSSKKNLDLHLAIADRPFSNVHVTDPGTDTQFLQRIISLQESLDQRPLADIFLSDTCRHLDTGDVKVQVSDPAHFVLERKDIARVVPERIFDVIFLPSKEKYIIAAGDKSGHIGLWDADCDLEEGDGVHIYRPHTSPVSAIASNVYDITKLISCSYDGYARVLDMGKSVFNVIHASEKILTALCYSPDSSSCVYLGDDEGTMRCVDIRERKLSSSVSLHNRRINSVQLNPQSSQLMLTGSTDGTACLWDMRCLGKGCLNNLAVLKHPRAVQSAYFSPSGNHIASTSYDDCVRVWSGLFWNTLTAYNSDAAHLDKPAIIPHNNQTNRWLSTFRAIWGWNDSHLFVGNMGRAIDVLSVEEKRATVSLRADIMTSIPCRFACHSLLPGLLAGGTAGGKVYFWR